MEPEALASVVTKLKSEYQTLATSAEFLGAKKEIITKVTETAPVAQRILVRAIENATEDRERLVVDLTKATISGGTTVGPLVAEHTINASFEVLSEEGLITAEQASALRAGSTFLQAMNGANSAEDVIDIAKAISDSYEGLVEIDLGVKSTFDL